MLGNRVHTDGLKLADCRRQGDRPNAIGGVHFMGGESDVIQMLRIIQGAHIYFPVRGQLSAIYGDLRANRMGFFSQPVDGIQNTADIAIL